MHFEYEMVGGNVMIIMINFSLSFLSACVLIFFCQSE